MERKFTDDEIVKALECCREKDCGDCPMSEYPQTICEWDAFDIAIDLINRKKAEIESLKEAYAIYEETTGLKWARAEAIKEFAERLRAKSEYGTINVSPWQIDNLVKEMIGGNNGN